MTKRVSFTGEKGAAAEGELAEPSGDGRGPAVVLLQEWWGLNDHIRDLCERLAREGFLVLAPDLYRGKVTKDAGEAERLMKELDTLAAVDTIAGAVAFLRGHPRGNGKVGVTGFCMGGALSFASACHIGGLGAVVPFYGVPPADKVDYARVTAPIQFHVARRDYWVTVDKAEAVKKELEGHGKSVEVHVYEADHAFVNDTRPEVHDPASAKLAWERAVAFLKRHLA